MTPAEFVRELCEPGDRVEAVPFSRDAGRGQGGVEPGLEQHSWSVATAASVKANPRDYARRTMLRSRPFTVGNLAASRPDPLAAAVSAIPRLPR
ncbi:MAG: hypothetical protein OXJ37_21045 [Bryobacterales bacterium]|nr:hypothetical protein [Bryobacterales bacterium]MDE0264903.1 hypothetical protein [Bryobacterales bacterium]MDE0624106.1 hypothetical protein [Bryobacterales bacterium]